MTLAKKARSETFLQDVSPEALIFSRVQGASPGQIQVLPDAAQLPWRVRDVVQSQWCNANTGQIVEVEAKLPADIFCVQGDSIQAQGIRIDILPPSGQVTWACYCANLIQQRLLRHPELDLKAERDAAIARAKDHAIRCNYWVFQAEDGFWHCQPLVEYQPGDPIKVVRADPGLEDDLNRNGQVMATREVEASPEQIKVLLQGDALARFFRPEQIEPCHPSQATLLVTSKLDSLNAEIAALEREEQELLAEGPLQQGWVEPYTKRRDDKEFGPYYTLVIPQEGKRPLKKGISRKDVAEVRQATKRRQRVEAIHRRLEVIHRDCRRLDAVKLGQAALRQPLEAKPHGEYEIWDTRDGHTDYPHSTFSIMAFRWEHGTGGSNVRGPVIFRRRLPIDASSERIAKAKSDAEKAICKHRD